ncbi:unnamed protein product [Trichogramma brassicae]|uniref:Uncharacterized protein n=1 Tax=Trichogramma brassicae TaxID=86971 RepID=A0A6H5IKA9_9HYME|nr:unnamed protein product [Trichogramma brassicae]
MIQSGPVDNTGGPGEGQERRVHKSSGEPTSCPAADTAAAAAKLITPTSMQRAAVRVYTSTLYIYIYTLTRSTNSIHAHRGQRAVDVADAVAQRHRQQQQQLQQWHRRRYLFWLISSLHTIIERHA